MKKIIVKGIIILAAAVGSFLTGIGLRYALDEVDDALDEGHKNEVNNS